jgi:hypothetical protein
MSTESGKKSWAWLVALFAAAVVIVAWCTWWTVARDNWNADAATYAKFGQFGDMFGSLNALFAGLAFVGVIFTIYRQLEDGSAVDERHIQSLGEQARITKIQGLTALLNFDAQKVADFGRKIRYLSTLRDQVIVTADTNSNDKALSYNLDRLESMVADALTHLSIDEFKEVGKLLSKFKTSRNNWQEVKRTPLGKSTVELREKNLRDSVGDAQSFIVGLLNEVAHDHDSRLNAVNSHRTAIIEELSNPHVSIRRPQYGLI